MTTAFARLGRHAGGGEIVSARTLRSKTFDLGGGARKLVQTREPLHYTRDDGSIEDIDTEPRRDGKGWIVDRAPYVLRVASTGVIYEGRLSGLTVDAAVAVPGPVEIDGERVWWHLDTDRDAAVWIRPASIVLETWLRSADAEPVVGWAIKGAPDEWTGEDADGRPIEMDGRRFTGRVSQRVSERTRQRRWQSNPTWPVRLR